MVDDIGVALGVVLVVMEEEVVVVVVNKVVLLVMDGWASRVDDVVVVKLTSVVLQDTFRACLWLGVKRFTHSIGPGKSVVVPVSVPVLVWFGPTSVVAEEGLS